MGSAKTLGENANVVRIMSIHKSKGLEFPIVFVTGLTKQFNQQDTRQSIILHSDLGAGIDMVDVNFRTKAPTILKKVIQQRVQKESIAEELRVLYVAMTRAQDILILSNLINKNPALEELKENLKNSSILIVAQRVGTIIDADKIIVLDRGQVVGTGTHEELLKSCDVYKDIVASQLSEEEATE